MKDLISANKCNLTTIRISCQFDSDPLALLNLILSSVLIHHQKLRLKVRLPHGLQNMTYSRLCRSHGRQRSSQFTDWVTRHYYTKLKHLKNWDRQASGKYIKKKTRNPSSQEFSRGSKNYMLLCLYPRPEISVQLPLGQLMKQQQWARSIKKKVQDGIMNSLSQDAVEIKTFMAFRRRDKIIERRIHSNWSGFWYSFWLRKFLHCCLLGDYNWGKITGCMPCCLNASCLGQTVFALLETEHWARQTSIQLPTIMPTLAQTASYEDDAHTDALSNPQWQKRDVREETYTSHQA